MPDFSEEFKVSIVADVSDLEAKISDSTQKLKIFKEKANQDAQIKLRVNIAELESKISEARKRLSDFKKEGDRVGEIKTSLEISSLQQNKSTASRVLKDLSVDATNTGKSFFNLNQIIVDGLKAFGAYTIISAFAGALKSAFSASVEFESAFAGIKKTVDATEEQFAKLSDDMISLSKTIPVSASELAKIGEVAGQLGVKQKDILEFTKTIAAIGVSTNLSQEEAATAFARISNIYQQPIEKVENLASSVVALGNNFATTETEIVDFTTRIAGAGKNAGLATSDLTAISAAFSSVGVQAEAGGTAVAKTLQSITDAVNKGGQDLNNFASISGVSAKTFSDLWRSDPVEAFNLFIKGLGASGDKASQVLEDLVAGDARVKRAFLSVAGAGDLLTRTINTSRDAFEANVALTTEAEKRYATTESKLKELGNRFGALQISAGNFLKQAALPVLDFFVTLSEALAGQPNQLSDVASAIKVISAPAILLGKSLILLVEIISKAYNAFQNYKKVLDDGSVSSKILKTGVDLLGKALLLLLAPLSAISSSFLTFVNGATALDTAAKNLKKTLNENFKSPSLDATSKQFQTLLDSTAKTSKALEGLKKLQSAGFGNQEAPGQLGGDGNANVNKTLSDAASASSVNVDKLQASTLNLLQTMGLTTDEIFATTQQLGIFNGETQMGVEDQQRLNAVIQEHSPLLNQLALDFGATAESAVASGKSWKDGIKIAVDESKKQYEKNGQNADAMIKNIQELYVANVAKTKDLGTAAGVAYGSGFGATQTRNAIETGVGSITDRQLLLELKAAELSGENGKAAGLLLALGFGDRTNIDEVANSGNKLHQSIQNAFNSARVSISATGKSAGSTLVAGIINGINQQLPGLASVLSRIVKSIGGLSAISSTLNGVAEIAIGKEAVGELKSFLGKIGNTTAALKKQFNELGTSGKELGATPPFAGSGGGGGGKGLDEAKKRAEQAQKAVEDFTKEVENNNKASEKLRDKIVDFYKDIVDSIDKAREKQADLRGELEKFVEEQNTGLAGDAAKRDADLAEKEKDAIENLKKAKEDAAKIDAKDTVEKNATANANALAEQNIAQLKYNKAVADGDEAQKAAAKLALDKADQKVAGLKVKQDSTATQEQQDLVEANNKVLEAQETLNKIQNERSKIAEFQTGLLKTQSDAQKKYDEAVKSGNASQITESKKALGVAIAGVDEFNKVQERQKLTDFEQTQLQVKDKILEKEKETKAEDEKQQRIIDIQNKFLEIQKGKTIEAQKAKQQLIDLATSDEILSQEQKQKKLSELGFNNLTVDEEAALLKQVQQVNALDIELKAIQDQQAEILSEKNKFQKLAEDYHGESIEKMKLKEKELIDLIKNAQTEQQKLNDLRSASSQASSAISNTTVSVVNNNGSNVDAEAANRKLLSKIK